MRARGHDERARVTVVTRLARVLRWGAMFALVAMMLVTAVDISMRNALNQLVHGSVELVQLTIVLVVFLALPETFLRNEQITVDAIDQFISARWVSILRATGALLTLVLLTTMVVWMVPQAIDTLVIGDLTTDLQISLFWFWLPILIGGCASILTMLIVVRDEMRAAGAMFRSG
jgi:TRAP-type C4-dicarboxylate transport system permease small subunit